MAVVPKQRKNSTTFYVATWFAGKAYWERSGTDKREAERLDARRKREVADGTFQPHEVVKTSTVAEYAKSWGDARENASAKDDRRNLARFTELPEFAALHLDDVRPRHIIDAINKLRRGSISEKTVHNAYGSLQSLFRAAYIAELVRETPCRLERNFWALQESHEREPYERSEAAVLCRHAEIPDGIRVLNAMCLLGGLREGEACGRRWCDLTDATPLPSLDVRTQYEGRALKTRKKRAVPVHPELAAMLEQWGRVGFVELMGRPPNPNDFIVPRVSNRDRKGHHTRSTYYKAFVAACGASGVRARSLHSTRHTMITLALRGGAVKEDLRKVTHNPKGDIVDQYNHQDWSQLCRVVLAIGSLDDFGARPSPRRFGNDPPDPGVPEPGTGVPLLTDSSSEDASCRVQFPAPPLRAQHKTSPPEKTRQSSRQSESVSIAEELRAASDRAFRAKALFWFRANGPAGPSMGAVG
jgi:integrase